MNNELAIEKSIKKITEDIITGIFYNKSNSNFKMDGFKYLICENLLRAIDKRLKITTYSNQIFYNKIFFANCFNGIKFYIEKLSTRVMPQFINELTLQLNNHECDLIFHKNETIKSKQYYSDCMYFNILKRNSNHD
jgi:hypothetical protein